MTAVRTPSTCDFATLEGLPDPMTAPISRLGGRRWIPATAAVGVLAVSAIAAALIVVRPADDTTTNTAAAPVVSPTPGTAPPAAVTEPSARAPQPAAMENERVASGLPSAREPLQRLAAALTTSPADTDRGTFEDVAEQQWAGDTTVVDGVGTTVMMVMAHRRWRAPDGSGRVETRDYPPGTATITARSPSTSLDVRTFGPGELTGPVRLRGDRAGVTAALRAGAQPENGVMDVVRGVDELCRSRALQRAARAAVLTVLADAGLDWAGPSTDKLGRARVSVSVDTRTIGNPGVRRDILSFDPATGDLTGYELVLLTNPGALTGTFPQTADLHLYTARGRQTTPR
jgi:hypothetical protein